MYRRDRQSSTLPAVSGDHDMNNNEPQQMYEDLLVDHSSYDPLDVEISKSKKRKKSPSRRSPTNNNSRDTVDPDVFYRNARNSQYVHQRFTSSRVNPMADGTSFARNNLRTDPSSSSRPSDDQSYPTASRQQRHGKSREEDCEFCDNMPSGNEQMLIFPPDTELEEVARESGRMLQQLPLELRLALHDDDFTADDYEDLLQLDECIVNKGLDAHQISLLPTRRFSKSELDATERCCICLEKYKSHQNLKVLPCNHKFHGKCIDKWLQKRARCPICMKDMKP